MRLHNIAALASLSMVSLHSYSSEALISLQVNQGVYETNTTSGGQMTSARGSLLIESETGFFHRATVHTAIDAISDPSGEQERYLNAEYNLGTFWYPKASANDYSIWSGIGHWEHEDSIGNAGNVDRTARALYMPLGFEGAMPVSYPTSYFVFGADVKLGIDSTVEVNGVKESDASSIGYSAWLGMDFQFDSGSALEIRLEYTGIEIDASDYEFTSNLISLGYRF
jgi:hypothetical protein